MRSQLNVQHSSLSGTLVSASVRLLLHCTWIRPTQSRVPASERPTLSLPQSLACTLCGSPSVSATVRLLAHGSGQTDRSLSQTSIHLLTSAWEQTLATASISEIPLPFRPVTVKKFSVWRLLHQSETERYQ